LKIRDKAEIILKNGETVRRNIYAIQIGNTSSTLFRYGGQVYFVHLDDEKRFRQGRKSILPYNLKLG